jgi:hypothetical protein
MSTQDVDPAPEAKVEVPVKVEPTAVAPVETKTEPTPAPATEPTTPTEETTEERPWYMDRIAKLSAENARYREAVQPPPQEAAQVATTQDQITPQQFQQAVDRGVAQRQFDEACTNLYRKGESEFKDFPKSVEMLRTMGVLDVPTAQAVLKLENGHKILYELGKNPGEAQRFLGLDPITKAVELAKFASKVPAAPAPKAVSNAPAPITPQVGAGASLEKSIDDPTLSTAEWMALRAKTKKTRL